VGRYHANRAPGLDSLDKHGQAAGNAQAQNRESVRHAYIRKAASMLFSRPHVAYERVHDIKRRNLASVAELKKSFFAEIGKVENDADVPAHPCISFLNHPPMFSSGGNNA
jgi:hypothetical protein